jgi:hypothetical protein
MEVVQLDKKLVKNGISTRMCEVNAENRLILKPDFIDKRSKNGWT